MCFVFFYFYLSSQEQHPSQASIILYICPIFRILHAPSNSLHQWVNALHKGLRSLWPTPAPIPSQLWGAIHFLTWSASPSTSSATRYSQLTGMAL